MSLPIPLDKRTRLHEVCRGATCLLECLERCQVSPFPDVGESYQLTLERFLIGKPAAKLIVTSGPKFQYGGIESGTWSCWSLSRRAIWQPSMRGFHRTKSKFTPG